MQFRTEIEPIHSDLKINLKTTMLTIGSCFSDVMGQRLADNKLNCLVNPFGTIFNPISIFKLLSGSKIDENHFTENQGAWFHHDYHSRFWANSQDELLTNLQQIHQKVKETLENVDMLVITFGTALVFQLNKDNQIISNCHKVPNSQFERRMLSQKEIIDSFHAFYKNLKLINPEIKILLTVSPVRHTKDTLSLNSASKSILRAVCYQLETAFENVSYFPSYEIMLDDLRDYRFYKSDMIHPNEVAEDYIFEKFGEAYFDEKLVKFIANWKKIKAGLAHRPLQNGTIAHQKFLQNLLFQLENLSNDVNVSLEIEELKYKLSAEF